MHDILTDVPRYGLAKQLVLSFENMAPDRMRCAAAERSIDAAIARMQSQYNKVQSEYTRIRKLLLSVK